MCFVCEQTKAFLLNMCLVIQATAPSQNSRQWYKTRIIAQVWHQQNQVSRSEETNVWSNRILNLRRNTPWRSRSEQRGLFWCNIQSSALCCCDPNTKWNSSPIHVHVTVRSKWTELILTWLRVFTSLTISWTSSGWRFIALMATILAFSLCIAWNT